MRLSRQLGMFITVAILLSSCAPVDLMVGGEKSVSHQEEQSLELPVQVSVASEATGNVEEVNECLNCHSDKNRLIETADPVVEEAESESSGVG